jgi:trimeric autotransporter adhesin
MGGLLITGLFWSPVEAGAQSDVLMRLRSGSPAGDRVRVDSAGGFVALGNLGLGIIPATGSGERMMWHPYKGAFRAGSAGNPSTAWDDANIGFYSWAGGHKTQASAIGSVALGGETIASGVYSTALGYLSNVSGTAGFAAGERNECTGINCTAIGQRSRAAGQGSVAIGTMTHSSQNYGVALGYRAVSRHMGAFVWGDASTADSILSTANNQFSTRAAGGYRLYSNAMLTAGVAINPGGSSWNIVSDRNRKMDFRQVDGEDVLHRLRAVPVTFWRYRDEADRAVRHIGPMAQDWERAFRFGGDGTTINMSDFDGVNLAAIQALETRTSELQRTITERDRRIETLEQRAARLEAANTELEARLHRIEEHLRSGQR